MSTASLIGGRLRHALAEDRWIPWTIVGAFVALTGVLAWFIYLAVSTYPGLVTDDPYHRGLNYQQALEAQAAQARQGWSLALSYDGAAGEPHPLVVTLKDRDGLPVTGATVAVLAERPARHAQIIPFALAEIGDGRYAADVRLPLGGRWVMSAIARTDHGEHRERVEIVLEGSHVR